MSSMQRMEVIESIVGGIKDAISPAFDNVGTFLGYFFRGLLFVVVAIIYLPAFLLVTYLNKPFEDMLKEFGL